MAAPVSPTSSVPTEPARGRPGRQRSEAADQAILAATLDVLGEDGFGGLTMAAVIARSGVSSATLYRRWPTKQDLVAAALASLHPAATEIDTGSLEGDIVAFVRDVAASMAVRPAGEALRQDVAVELSRNPDFRAAINEKFVVPRLVVLGHVLRAEPPARARELLHRAFAVAGPDAVVVVTDYPRPAPPTDDETDRAATLAAARHELTLALTMLASTDGAGVTVGQLSAWAAEAGWHVSDRLEPLPRQHVFLLRPDGAARSDRPARTD